MAPGDLHYEDFEPTWISDPDTLGRTTLGITLFLGATCILVMSLRMYARATRGGMALDDWSMTIATCFFTVACVFCGMCVYAGVGSKDDKQISSWNMIAGAKWLTFWQLMYALSLPFIKFSIGQTILRITTQPGLRIAIWVIVGLSCMSCIIGFFAVVLVCIPTEKSWMGALVEGHCAEGAIITKISYLISVLAVVTDWGCAIIPAIVVWGLQMKTKLKISISFVLALGAVASAATIVRLPYLPLYNATENFLNGLAYIIVWSNIECGLGIIAGSLPSLRALLTFWLGKSTDRQTDGSQGATSGARGTNKARRTGGQSMHHGATGKGTHNVTTCAAEGDGEWIQLEDSESQKHMITATHDVTVQYENKNAPASDSSRPHSRDPGEKF